MNIPGRLNLKTAMLLCCVFGLATCGEDEATAAGVDWLKANPQLPGNSGWNITEVLATGDREFEILVDLNSVEAAQKLSSLSAMDKGEVARLGCPIRGTEFWEIVGNKATVKVKLNSKGVNKASAICRR